jgi:uncharacterized protein
MDDRIIEKAAAYVKELFAADAGGHGADHTLRVYRTAMCLAESEPGCDKTVTALAALLHDADDYKLFQTENNANARRFLAENGVPAETAYGMILLTAALTDLDPEDEQVTDMILEDCGISPGAA